MREQIKYYKQFKGIFKEHTLIKAASNVKIIL